MEKNKVDKIKEVISNSNFNGAVRIEYNSEPIISEGYGSANFEHNVHNKPNTKFRIASITKQFTAAAILQMYDKNLLKLEDAIDTYIPDYPNGSQITIHHLLTHSPTGF